MTRRDIAFDAEGVTLRGWFYPAEGTSGPGAAVVMAHGFSAVKEMYLDSFAEAFAAAGLSVLVFDNRCFGASDGEPRQEIDPWAQVRDYRHAITYLHTVPEVDPGRIGIWGSSYSGGHVLVVGAIDRRVKAVVSQVPLISGRANIRALVRADFIAGFREQFDADRLARFEGKAPAMVPVVDKDPLAASALPTPDSWEWFSQTGETRAPAWRNEVTLRTVEMLGEYEPGTYLPYISPTPLLLLVAEGDHLTPSEFAIAAFDTAHQPKELIIMPGGHFDAYTKGFAASSGPARDWFLRHLTGLSQPVGRSPFADDPSAVPSAPVGAPDPRRHPPGGRHPRRHPPGGRHPRRHRQHRGPGVPGAARNDIDGASMSPKQHRWSIHAVCPGAAGPARVTGAPAAAEVSAPCTGMPPRIRFMPRSAGSSLHDQLKLKWHYAPAAMPIDVVMPGPPQARQPE